MGGYRVSAEGVAGFADEVGNRLLAWLREQNLQEVRLVPRGSYFEIHVNGAPEAVPGVVVPAELLSDAEALLEVLEAARLVFDHETAKAD